MAAKMFAPVQEEKKSKIYQALNPQVLWYESRREKEMKNEENDDEAEDNRVCQPVQLLVSIHPLNLNNTI